MRSRPRSVARFRALKTWFTLKTYGTEKLGAVIARTCALAGYLEARILAEPRLELLAPVQLNIVCFRYRAADANKVNGEIVVDIQESGIAAPSTTLLDGQLAIRAAIVNHRTDTCDLDALVAAVIRFGTARTKSIALSEPPRPAATGASGASRLRVIILLHFGASMPGYSGMAIRSVLGPRSVLEWHLTRDVVNSIACHVRPGR